MVLWVIWLSYGFGWVCLFVDDGFWDEWLFDCLLMICLLLFELLCGFVLIEIMWRVLCVLLRIMFILCFSWWSVGWWCLCVMG